MTEQGTSQQPLTDEPEQLERLTHKFSVGGHEGYLTVRVDSAGNVKEMYIVFAREGSAISGWADGFAKMATLALRRGVPLQAVIGEIKNMRFEPQGRTTSETVPIARSPPDYIARWLEVNFAHDRDLLVSRE